MERALLKIHGIVQGVGFRPFIHKLVGDYALAGYIKNSSSGVVMELEGSREDLERFVADIPEKAPGLAFIEKIELKFLSEPVGYKGFEIRKSLVEDKRNTLISPDVCICEDCLRELFDPADRRYRYPFINCTNCGPRFTIVKDIPYDRAKTSMSEFPMCSDCEKEYGDIENRRYHAQPDCCGDCGPRVFYLDKDGVEIPGDAIELARKALKAGKIVAIKGLGGVHLACRCDDAALTQELRRRKHRDEKPFALMCRDVEAVRGLCHVSEDEEKALLSHKRPIVLLKKREKGSLSHVSENGYVGVMLPYTPLHYLLMGEDIDALIMTSANLSDCPIIFKNTEAVEKLTGIADGFLLNNREIQSRCDDSLIWVLNGREYPVRRSRGYVPYPVRLDAAVDEILACGAEQKASFCLSRGNYVFPSAHIGDLKNLETLENYEGQISHFQRLFDVKPKAIVCDMHPDYMSTRYATERSEAEGIPLIQVQHHHAHMAACMADNGLDKPVIGLIWDGTGYGTDGSIWGGECLIGDYEGFERFGSILPIPLIGGDKAAKELERISFALLDAAGLDTGHIENAPMYKIMLEKGFNCPLSSGMGRLFDGVAAILGIKKRASYEGQGAVLLEAAATEAEGFYPFELSGSPLRFDWREMIRTIVRERHEGIPTGEICARFLNTLMEMARRMCLAARAESGINDVVLSGGSFQNMYIMERLPELLRREGFQVWTHSRVSTNDEGLSLGQIMLAQAALK
ncbi:MAG: carbamoyltransferase HypF [Oscillospiraceae bacterium]|nr:carbamoyltransferase HypF [Oscillospiraceae bacterium]